MIRDKITGAKWGRSKDIVVELGLDPDHGPEMIRAWGRRGLVERRRIRGGVWYCLDECLAVEQRTRRSGRGRPRMLDMGSEMPEE